MRTNRITPGAARSAVLFLAISAVIGAEPDSSNGRGLASKLISNVRSAAEPYRKQFEVYEDQFIADNKWISDPTTTLAIASIIMGAGAYMAYGPIAGCGVAVLSLSFLHPAKGLGTFPFLMALAIYMSKRNTHMAIFLGFLAVASYIGSI